jgi:hypothetical protein
VSMRVAMGDHTTDDQGSVRKKKRVVPLPSCGG